MRIIITGGAGFIGSNLAKALQEKHEILIIDKMQGEERFANGNLKCLGHFKNLLDFNGELIIGCINDLEVLEVMDGFKPEVIFHEAAISDTTALNQNEVLSINLNSFNAIINIAKKHNAKLIYASSASVYGPLLAPQKVGYEKPLNPYAFSKLFMDKMAKRHAKEMHIVGLRYFNVYGPGEFYKGKSASMVTQFGLQIMAGITPILFEKSDEIRRDFVYIDDVIAANLAALEAKSGVYNVGFGKSESFAKLLDIVQENLNSNFTPKIIPNPYKKAYQFHTQAVLDESFAYRPLYDLSKGIKKTIPYLQKIFEEEF